MATPPTRPPQKSRPRQSSTPTTCEAFVLRVQDYREADRIVWLMTENRGRVSAIARGARKSRRRFGGHLDLFQRVRVGLTGRSNGSLQTLTDARTVEPYPALRDDVERYAMGSVVAEMVSHLARDESEDRTLFDAVGETFELLADPQAPATLPTLAATVVHLLSTAGFVMDLSSCGSCGRALQRGARLDPAGHLICEACGAGFSQGRHLTQDDVHALATWQSAALVRVAAGAPPEGAVGAAFDLLHHVLGRHLRSETFAWQLLPTS